MTNNNQDLDALLRAWAQNREAATPELDRLATKVASDVANEPYLEFPAEPPWPSRRWLAPALAGFCGAIAVSLLLCVWLLRPAPPASDELVITPSIPTNSVPSLALWTPAELAEKQLLLSAVNAEFGGGLAWLAEHGKEVSLHVARSEHLASDSPLAIRIVMFRRGHGDSQWTQVWGTDVVTHSEQWIDALPGATTASVWAYALPDGLISIDSDLNLEVPLRVHVQFSGLLKSGIPRQIFTLETADEEYRIYQTVAALPAEKIADQPGMSVADKNSRVDEDGWDFRSSIKAPTQNMRLTLRSAYAVTIGECQKLSN